MQKFIVAEVTKNWSNETPVADLISQKFELVINTNAGRGYKLVDWKFGVVHSGDMITETIIAVFVLDIDKYNLMRVERSERPKNK